MPPVTNNVSRLLRLSPDEDDAVAVCADWVEFSAMLRDDGTTSREDLIRELIRTGETVDDRARQLANSAFVELADRVRACGGAPQGDINCYPFTLSQTQTLLSFHANDATNDSGLVYRFLLAVTLADMHSSVRRLAGHDPTALFERLCADTLREFIGGKPTFGDTLVFGTAGPRQGTRVEQKFPSGVDHLCATLGEGKGWKTSARSAGAGDGGLDLVAFRRFKDQRPGALVAFAQCKTGFGWRQHLSKLRPESFCKKYMRNPLLVAPLRVFMVPSRILSERWEDDTNDGGLLLDRCRIVEYSMAITPELKQACKAWLESLLTAGQRPR